MDTLKAALYIVFVMLGVTAIAQMMNYVGMTTTFNSTVVGNKNYAQDLVDSWGWSDNPFYDIATGLISFWLGCVPIIESFPYMLAGWGAPTFIYVPLHTIWRVLWLTALALGIIAGRTT